MFNYAWKAGVTSKSVTIRIIDATDGTPELGVVFNTAGIDLQYRREGAASVAITEVTLAALTTAYTSGGFLHIGNGYYRLDVPDAAFVAGSDGVLIHGIVNGMVVIGCYVQLVAYDPFDAVRLGLTALPNAAAEAAGGLYTRGTGAGQINQPANGRVDTNVVTVAGTTQTARDLGTSVLISSGTGTGQLQVTAGVVQASLVQILGSAITGTAAQIAAAFGSWFNVATPTGTVNSLPAATPGAAGGVFVAGTNAATTVTTSLTTTFTGNLTGSVGSVTGAVGSIAANGLTATSIATGAIDADAVATDAATEIADAVWNSTRAGHTTAGSFGEGVSSVQGNVTGSVASVTGAVGSVTGNVGGNVVGSVASVSGSVASVTGAVGSVTGNVGGNVVGTVASVVGAVGSVAGNVGGNVTGSVGSLAAQAKTDVNNEVLDVLTVDTFSEPPQGAPGVNISLKDKIGYLYKAFRNRITQTATTLSIFADDASTVDQKATVSDDGSTYNRSEISSGP